MTNLALRAACLSLFVCAGCQVVTGLDGLRVVDAGDGSSTSPVRASDSGAARGDAGSTERDATPPEEPGGFCNASTDCARGHTCDAHTCRKNCRADGECSSGVCARVQGKSSARVCWAACSREDTSACGVGSLCRTLQNPSGEAGTYCAAPADPCPTAEDGKCDDSRGTGECADGSDSRDCDCKPELPGAACDPVAQCGCPKEQACAVMRESKGVSAACMPWTGAMTADAACKADTDCAAGYVCRPGGTCARLCGDDAACGGGACLPIVWSEAPSSGLKVCYTRCDRKDPSCPDGTRCAHFDRRFPFQGDYCVAPLSSCPESDGVCDESRGSGLCSDDSDVVDCCQPSLPGGECDLVKQCGCEKKPGTSCTEGKLGDLERTSVCAVPGSTLANNWCLDGSSCARGLGCTGHVCRPFCASDVDCAKGARCIFDIRNGVASSVKVCLDPCTPETNTPCGRSTICNTGMIEDRLATGCTFMPFTSDCPTNDGRCDEPEGTALCTEGSDPVDCGPK